jgi:acetyltransferase
MALVAVDRHEGRPRILASARYYLEPETQKAEYAVVVSDPVQGHGLGRYLMERLVAVARERGVRRLFGPVLSENNTMLSLVRSLGFQVEPTSSPDTVLSRLDLV